MIIISKLVTENLIFHLPAWYALFTDEHRSEYLDNILWSFEQNIR